MQKQLPKPTNWQDFELLCKKLWGEIWQVPAEIKRNGRAGQVQHGIDLYAVPKGEIDYSGIQCKVKDAATGAKLTQQEIAAELKKAAGFGLPLARIILATTANKDAVIERHVCQLDLESRRAGGSRILLYCWEDIAELLDEYPTTLAWYLSGQQLKGVFDCALHFADDSTSCSIEPAFVRHIRVHEYPAWSGPASARPLRRVLLQGKPLLIGNPLPLHMQKLLDLVNIADKLKLSALNPPNLARCELTFALTNTGQRTLDDWHILVEFAGEFSDLVQQPHFIQHWGAKRAYSTAATLSYGLPGPLVQGASHHFKAFIIPLPETYVLPIRWKLLARDFSQEGTLQLVVKPDYTNEIVYQTSEAGEDLQNAELLRIEAMFGS